MTNLDYALSYASKNWPVLPLHNITPEGKCSCSNPNCPENHWGKHPRTTNGLKDATTSEQQILAWWTKWPDANIGVALGDTCGWFILDIDPRHGGNYSIEEYDIPDTRYIQSGSGGNHYHFKNYPWIRSKNNILPGVDIKANGGYAVMPPSNHASGGVYAWADEDLPVAEPPAWLIGLLTKSKSETTTDPDKPIQQGSRNEFLARLAGAMRRKGCSQSAITAALIEENKRCSPPLNEEEVKQIAKSISKYKPSDETNIIWDINNNKVKQKTLRNVINFLQTDENLNELFRLNLFNQTIEFSKDRPWQAIDEIFDDGEAVALREYLGQKHSFDVSCPLIFDAVLAQARKHAYHPVKDYLNSLKWDGTPRIWKWLNTYLSVEDSLYSQKVGEMTLVAAVARIFHPGIKYDHMLVIEGRQRMGKSLCINILGKKWFSEISLVDKDKDTVGKMMGKWILEVGEMEVLKKKEIESIKAFITTQSDRVRLPYQRTTKDFPRQNIFIGTINPDGKGYFMDSTGNTRFFPVLAHKCDIQGLQRDVDQLWAEAVQTWNKGYDLFISDSKINDMCIEEQESRFSSDEWTIAINDWIKSVNISPNKMKVTGVDIWKMCFDGDIKKFSRMEQNRIAKIMRRLGYERKRMSIDGDKKWGYDLRVPLLSEEKEVPVDNLKIEWDE